MIEIFQATFLGIVQGLTEFLPVSSSGHLIFLPNLLNWRGVVDTLSFDVALHVGTTIAVIWFFWADWLRIIKAFFSNLGKNLTRDPDSKLLLMVLVGSIPAGVVGLMFKEFIEDNTREPLLVAATLFIFALVLLLSDKLGSKKREFGSIGWFDAVFIGAAQAMSLVPGVSRSGITISAGLFSGLDRQAATRFSFLLSTPAITGAALLSLKGLLDSSAGGNLTIFIVGTISAAVVGWLAIKFLLKFVASNNFNIFVWYRILLAIGLAIYLTRT
jgi:undecaprenyl-diphosphatase